MEEVLLRCLYPTFKPPPPKLPTLILAGHKNIQPVAVAPAEPVRHRQNPPIRQRNFGSEWQVIRRSHADLGPYSAGRPVPGVTIGADVQRLPEYGQ